VLKGSGGHLMNTTNLVIGTGFSMARSWCPGIVRFSPHGPVPSAGFDTLNLERLTGRFLR
jgi:hypothetical protein